MKNALILILIFLALSVYAQKRNIIKPLAIDFEYMDYMRSGTDANFSNVFNYKIGYERMIGQRTSVSLNYMRFISSMNKVGYYPGSAAEGPEKIPDYVFSNAEYTNKIQGLEYESRYFFNDITPQGIGSAYLGFIYGFLHSGQSLANATFREYNNGNTTISKDYPDKNINVHRLGLKWGYVASGILYSDVHIGLFYNNRPNDYNTKWISPSDIYPVNLVLGWHMGLPF